MSKKNLFGLFSDENPEPEEAPALSIDILKEKFLNRFQPGVRGPGCGTLSLAQITSGMKRAFGIDIEEATIALWLDEAGFQTVDIGGASEINIRYLVKKIR